ncbi:hypothetical protein AWB69_08944 [Caballeronia udeis]|uniref:Uncharacterized protein n=1 Tax=Caballeronia udeis TaxID=1232866 RepID=A0A158JWJ0_9BURK|nr:hypothetical protein [Caballeronia udeis]SAL73188.1 hypothetical protein AWB69_08944 [Caballeronia udeis]
MGSNWNEPTPGLQSQHIELLPALNAAVILSQVLSARVLNGLPIRPTQWNTLECRVNEWRFLLASDRSRLDPLTRIHLNILRQLMKAILDEHRREADAGAEVWADLQPIVRAANDHLQGFPMRVRKGTAQRRRPPATDSREQMVDA